MSSNGMKERDFQNFIVRHLTANGYEEGKMSDYLKDFCVDEDKLFRFLENSQPKTMKKLKEMNNYKLYILQAVQKKIQSGTVMDVWKEGIEVDGCHLDLAYFAPHTSNNGELEVKYRSNILSVTEELEYQNRERGNRIDLCVFVNGIPFALFELKNQATEQSYKHGIRQWKQNRDPSEHLMKQVPAFFSMDTQEAYLSTKLQGEKTFFLPFNKGKDGGKGNPIAVGKHSTHYVWEEVFQKDSVLDLINNFVFADASGVIIFPRYHQWDALRKVKADLLKNVEFVNYLFNHSAGSGKTYTITWLSHQLSKLYKNNERIFDSIIVLTDRLVLDKQLQDSISSVSTQKGVVQTIDDNSNQLANAINSSYPIVITTIQKFVYAKDKITTATGNKKYAIIVDEAHSSQTGQNGKTLREALNEKVKKEQMADRKNNLAFFAFTATPKDETLHLFGTKNEEDKRVPFHVYSMKQAIEENFILDVLQNYTTYSMYYKLLNNSPFNPLVDKVYAKRIIQGVVKEESIPHKVPIMLDHYHQKARPLLDGQGKAMIVASSIRQAILYKFEVDRYMEDKGYPFKSIVAFSGDKDVDGDIYNEEKINGFKSEEIASKFKTDDYHILIVANKFQTGFDEKKLVAMYLDKSIWEIQAVQTLSRLNRVMNGKDTTFVLDFANSVEDIQESFAEFYEGAMIPESQFSFEALMMLEGKLYQSGLVKEKQLHQFDHLIKTVKKEDRTAHVYSLFQQSQEVFDDFPPDQQKVIKRDVQMYIKVYNWMKLVSFFEDERGEKLTLLNYFLFHLNKYLNATDDVDKEFMKQESIRGLIGVQNFRVYKKHEGNIDIEAKERESKGEEVVGGGVQVKNEEFLNHILYEENSMIADQFPMMREMNKQHQEDMQFVADLVEKSEIKTFIKTPESINVMLKDAKELGLKALRKKNKNGLYSEIKTDEDKKNGLFTEILTYIYWKFQNNQK
jgi:type I restriction enzyme R subunit